MKKLTDEEIIKVLECCGKEYSCEKCILNTWLNKKRDCVGKILSNALDLINRKDEEIEKLKNELKITRNYIHENNLEYDLLAYSKRGSE